MKVLTPNELIPSAHGSHGRDGAIRTAWVILVPLFAIVLTAIHYAMTTTWKHADPELMAAFEAAAPFQFRLLMPAVVAALHAVLPFGVEVLFALTEVAGWMVLMVLAHHALVAFDIGHSELSRRVLALTVVVPVMLHLAIPDIQFRPAFVIEDGIVGLGNWRSVRVFRYVYDLPAAVFTFGLVLLLWQFVRTREGRWFMAYLGLFSLATINRETTVFMIPAFFAVCYPFLDRNVLLRTVGLQVLAFAIIQGVIQWLFADNANPNGNVLGTSYENHLIANLALLANPLYFMVYLVRFGAGLYWPPLLLRGFLDPFLGRALIGFGVPFVASALMFGRLQEHRVLVELMPLLWLAAIQALAAWTAVQQRAPGDRRRDDSTTADSGAPMGLIITVSSATVPGNGASPGGPARPIITVPSGGREARQPQPRRTSH